MYRAFPLRVNSKSVLPSCDSGHIRWFLAFIYALRSALIPKPWKSRVATNIGGSTVQYEQKLQHDNILENETHKDLILFPSDEIELKHRPKIHRTNASKEALVSRI